MSNANWIDAAGADDVPQDDVIGVEAAGEMNTKGIATLEEYFGLEAAPGYL